MIQKLSALPEWNQIQWVDKRIANREAPNKWGGKAPPPAVGARVRVTVNSIGFAVVLGYFEQEGFLGVQVQPENAPEWYRKQNGGNVPCNAFGSEISQEG